MFIFLEIQFFLFPGNIVYVLHQSPCGMAVSLASCLLLSFNNGQRFLDIEVDVKCCGE